MNCIPGIDLSDIQLCRLCLRKSKETTSVSAVLEIRMEYRNSYVERINVAGMIAECSPPDCISSFEFPKQICEKCLQRLHNSFVLRRMISESHSILEEVAKGVQIRAECNGNDAEMDTVIVRNAFCKVLTDIKRELMAVDGENIAEEFGITDAPPPARELLFGELPSFPFNECSVCSKIFNSHARLSKHLITKHSVRNDQNVLKPFHCDKCDKCYTTHANLAIHKASHSGARPFKCPRCEKSFTKESSLANHMSLHTGIRKHQCEICKRTFTTANILQQHRKTHAEQRPHLCTVCHKGFYTSNDLRAHFRTHTGEKPFLCNACGRSFGRKTHLNIHFRTHSGEKPYKCDTCDRAFAQSGDLTAHVRIHTGEKPYTCKICQKSFNQTSGLRSHMKSHTGERPYKCDICQKGFTQSSSLGRHLKFHSKTILHRSRDDGDSPSGRPYARAKTHECV